jgi:hypothetical protein
MKQKQLTTQETEVFLSKLLREAQGVVPPVCLWGQHGIGKTALIHALARRWNWPIQVIHPAQFEEMGDLLGLPYHKTADGVARSYFAPPEWVPQAEGPGILLIDDFNRADDRIIRGLMALLQERRLASWVLPKGWQILLTANPDTADYSVTPIDDAVRTRMLHLYVKFELNSWVSWAEAQELPSAGIDFVLQYPEQIDGQATTARTYTYFLELWQKSGHLAPDDPFLAQLAHSCLSPNTAQTFLTFLAKARVVLPSPEAILADWRATGIGDTLQELMKEKIARVDQVSLLCNRLLVYLQQAGRNLNEAQTQNLRTFLLLEGLSAEHRLLMLRGLSAMGHAALPGLLQERELSNLLIG